MPRLRIALEDVPGRATAVARPRLRVAAHTASDHASHSRSSTPLAQDCTVTSQCSPCERCHWCSDHGVKLLHYTQAPEYVLGNPYLIRGYRPELPLLVCLKSLFMWSNETVNIWSHLLGFVYFALCVVYDNLLTLPRARAHWDDHFVVSITLLCFQACMLLSTAFHLFYCMSERAHRVWLSLDMLGISIGLFGIYLSGIYYAFYCFHMWHNLYLAIFCLLAFTTLAAPLHTEWTARKFVGHRLVLYGFIAAYGIVPAIHFVVLNGGFESQVTQKFFPNVIVVYSLSFVAFCFYLLKFPECYFPGRLCFVGWSHQWWHVLILCALVWWRSAGLEILQYRLTHECAEERLPP